MSRAAPAALRRLATRGAIDRYGVQKIAQIAYEEAEAKRVEEAKAFVATKLSELSIPDADPFVSEPYARFVHDHKAVIAEVDGLTFGWFEANPDHRLPRSLTLVIEHCSCGFPMPYRIRTHEDIGALLASKEKDRARGALPYECSECGKRRKREETA